MNKRNASAAIEQRMREYFNRQIAWFDSMLDEVATNAADMERGEIDKVIKQHHARDKELADFSDEFWVLKSEWDLAENIAHQAREEIGALARKADGMLVNMQQNLDKGGVIAAALAQGVEGDLGKLRSGRQVLDRYRPGLSDIADFVDRKA